MNFKWWLAIAGLIVALVVAATRFIGCGGDVASTNLHVHGPHGGHALTMSLEKDYAMEYTVDEPRRKIVIYVFEKADEIPFAIPVDHLDAKIETRGKSFDITMRADPRSIDPKGNSSRFSIGMDDLPQ